MAKMRKERSLNGWKLMKKLGEGGNGEVWSVRRSSDEFAAIKILKRDSNAKKKYARFVNEVTALRSVEDVEGILPVLDYHLPEDGDDSDAWYVMPLAEPLESYLSDKDYDHVVQAIIEIGTVLNKLHDRGICHRDVKPANILVKDGKFCLADFGLVQHSERQDLTGTHERIGARWTIAPEMERNSRVSDGKPADVYSLAKTLWILLTGKNDSFEGQYDPNSVNGLSRLKLTEISKDGFAQKRPAYIYLKPLDDLLQSSTDHEPSGRPTMEQFVGSLALWRLQHKDFRQRNPLQWQDIQKKLFPYIVPARAVWQSVSTIVNILNLLASFDSLNHMHFPSGGGLDLLGARESVEPGTIELIINEKRSLLVKPRRLIFENFDFDLEWNYFRLEIEQLTATGIGSVYRGHEELVEVSPLVYMSLEEWEWQIDNDYQTVSNSRKITRCLEGDFLIVQKTGIYNQSPSTYDGRHSEMNSDEFRSYIGDKIHMCKDLLDDRHLMERITEKGIGIRTVMLNLMKDSFWKDLRQKDRAH